MAESFTTGKAPAGTSKPDLLSKKDGEYKIADVREDGTVTVEMEDGRMFPATIKDGVEGLRRGSKVTIKHEGMDKSDAPMNAVVDGHVQ